MIGSEAITIEPLDALTEGITGSLGVKIDTEGYEIEVIRGATETLKRSEFVIAECSIQRRFSDSYLFHELVECMASNRFGVVDILDINSKRRKHVDLIFVPIKSPLLDCV